MKITIPLQKRARIEMLPLIDIVFLLLVFFIYAMLSMAVHHGMPVILPSSATAEIENKMILSVSIDRHGALFLNESEITVADLKELLQREAATLEKQNGKQTGVLLFADKTIPYQQLFQVMDEIRKAGITRVSLQAERGP